VCQQLRPQADPQHWLALRQHAFDRTQFGAQVLAVRLVFHVHRSAQHDQAAVAVDVGFRFGLPFEIGETDAVAASADQGIQRAQGLGRDVLEDEDAGHAR